MTDETSTFRNTSELLAVANEYCYFIENISKYDFDDTIEFLRKILPMLYLKGCLIEPAEECDEAFMQRYVTEETYQDIYNEIRNKLIVCNEFYEFDNELKEPVAKTVAEGLTDIYQDMKDVLTVFMRGIEPEKICAVFYLHQWFDERWGAHIASLLPVLHKQYTDKLSGSNAGTDFD
jgi:hypothetical protein